MISRVIVSGIILTVMAHSLIASNNPERIKFTPINHATFIISAGDKSIYVDPVGDKKNFENFPEPDIILITDIHGDHLDTELIKTIKSDTTIIISPKAVFDKLQEGLVLDNGEKKMVQAIEIEAIPMYNLTKDRLKYHPKGRGNGYLLTIDGTKIYISGDTEDIPEMRELRDIDFAFICMNLPYTMTVEQAASAVLEMKPKIIIPYHYRGKGGLSDMDKFVSLVGVNKNIEVRLLEWYK